MIIIVHRGNNVIGGSCVELTTKTTRLILDLGLPLVDGNREPFDSRAALKKSVEVLKQERVIPGVSGLFDDESSPPDAILLSHAHLDHAGLLHLSRPTVPIYATEGTSKMMLAMAVFAKLRELDRQRFHKVTAGQTFEIGDCRVTAFAVDHSIYGSVAFLVEAEGKTILYTGDFRNHGRKPGMIKELLANTQNRTIDVLLVEGTHFGADKEQGKDEYDLEEKIVDLLKTAPALALATFSAVDVDRLVTLYNSAKRAGRIFAIDAYSAFVLYLIHRQTKVPEPTAANGIRVYFNQLFVNRNLSNLKEKFQGNRIELAEMLANPTKYLMVFRPSMIDLDFEGKLPGRCRCLYGYWKGYLTRPDWVQLQKQISDVGGDFIPAHVSGHVYIADLIEFVTAVRARTVIPIHTFEPQEFHKHFSNVQQLQDGQVHEVG